MIPCLIWIIDIEVNIFINIWFDGLLDLVIILFFLIFSHQILIISFIINVIINVHWELETCFDSVLYCFFSVTSPKLISFCALNSHFVYFINSVLHTLSAYMTWFHQASVVLYHHCNLVRSCWPFLWINSAFHT